MSDSLRTVPPAVEALLHHQVGKPSAQLREQFGRSSRRGSVRREGCVVGLRVPRRDLFFVCAEAL
ncbi:hypothetical protein ACIBBB_04470 [Streptomyces sp. NPDC051217]|uniref:hypothetical protein n=1 Tax=Streptomyces sp. NPDC051217 TaxID=3365644 RepID=UPI00378CA061